MVGRNNLPAPKDESKKRAEALNFALSQIEKQYGKGSIMRLGDGHAMGVEGISTGALSLDVALGGWGAPKGRIMEIFGPEASGQTTLCSHIVAEAQNHGMQIFDLTQLRNVATPPVTFSETAHYPGFGRCHDMVLNEATGYGYCVGSDTCNGGAHMMNLANPTAPVFAGCDAADGYTRDAQCVIYHGPDAAWFGQLLADMLPQFTHDSLVVPRSRADKGLDRLAVQAGLGCDRLAGLAFQAAEEAVDDGGGMSAVFDAVEAWEVALEEGGQAAPAALDGLGGERGVGQEGLGVGVIQEAHGTPSVPVGHASG